MEKSPDWSRMFKDNPAQLNHPDPSSQPVLINQDHNEPADSNLILMYRFNSIFILVNSAN